MYDSFVNSLCEIVVRVSNDDFGDFDVISLSDSVTSSDGLYFVGWIPVGCGDVYFVEHL